MTMQNEQLIREWKRTAEMAIEINLKEVARFLGLEVGT